MVATSSDGSRVGLPRAAITGLFAAVLMAGLFGCGAEAERAVVTVGSAGAFEMEVATTAAQQERGLAGRDAVSEGTGMLFVFDSPRTEQVWMAGMKVSIDIAWVADGRVVSVDTLQPCRESDQAQCPRWTSPTAVTSLLEVPVGSLAGVTAGATVTITEEESS